MDGLAEGSIVGLMLGPLLRLGCSDGVMDGAFERVGLRVGFPGVAVGSEDGLEVGFCDGL